MQKILALALVATAFGAFPSFAAEQSTSAMCGPDAPEAYKRPGGYCEQVKDTRSLHKFDDEDFYIIHIPEIGL